ncbi:MAG TPA: hypothetical protein PLO93_07355, partial [Candidatus Omnitrophota bacterium]|nr:hypothetical protein [Candidatus Omnitrophota bacterium]
HDDQRDNKFLDASWAFRLAQENVAFVQHVPSYHDMCGNRTAENWNTDTPKIVEHQGLIYELPNRNAILNAYLALKEDIAETWVTIDLDFFSLRQEPRPDLHLGMMIPGKRLYHLSWEEIDRELLALTTFFDEHHMMIHRVIPSMPSNTEEYLNLDDMELSFFEEENDIRSYEEIFADKVTRRIHDHFGELSRRQMRKIAAQAVSSSVNNISEAFLFGTCESASSASALTNFQDAQFKRSLEMVRAAFEKTGDANAVFDRFYQFVVKLRFEGSLFALQLFAQGYTHQLCQELISFDRDKLTPKNQILQKMLEGYLLSETENFMSCWDAFLQAAWDAADQKDFDLGRFCFSTMRDLLHSMAKTKDAVTFAVRMQGIVAALQDARDNSEIFLVVKLIERLRRSLAADMEKVKKGSKRSISKNEYQNFAFVVELEAGFYDHKEFRELVSYSDQEMANLYDTLGQTYLAIDPYAFDMVEK